MQQCLGLPRDVSVRKWFHQHKTKTQEWLFPKHTEEEGFPKWGIQICRWFVKRYSRAEKGAGKDHSCAQRAEMPTL